MKRYIAFLVFFLLMSWKPIDMSYTNQLYDIVEIFEVKKPQQGTKIITDGNQFVEVNHILVPTRLYEGNYGVKITRVNRDIYKIENTKYYIQTRDCYQTAYFDKAILMITDQYGYEKGKLSFNIEKNFDSYKTLY